MATKFVQGRTNNHLTWVMVDATDAFTPESALSAATKIKIYGTLETATGINFVSSGTGSLTNDIVHVGASVFGLYHIALAKADLSDASAAWYDEYVVVLSATGAAQQILVVEGVRTDTSYMSNILSNLSAIASDIYSALTLTNSRVLLNQSRISDTYSILTTMSDILSNVNSMLVAGTFALGASNTSDVASAVWAHTIGARVDSRVLLNQSRISDTYSLLSDAYSDILSVLGTTGVALNASTLSDLRSAITAGPAGALTVSDISDIASAVWATPLATKLVQLNTSDLSDLRSAITAGPAGALTVSDISDIASAVWATPLATKLVQLNTSDLSDLRSAITAATFALTASDLSDIASAVRVNLASDLSDILSAAQQTNSRALVLQSRVSDAYSLLSDFASDFQSRVPKLVATSSQLSDLHSDLRSYLLGLSGVLSDTYSGVQLLESTLVGQRGSLASTVTSPSAVEIDGIDHDDQYNGYFIKLQSGSQLGELRQIVDTVLASSQVVVRPAFTSRPVAGVRYTIFAGNPWLSGMHSDLRSYLGGMSDTLSNVNSMLLAGTFTLGASNTSDVASAVWAHTIGARVDSRLLVNQSRISDTYSMLTTMSDILSNVNSMLLAGTFTLGASNTSDVASAVWAHTIGARVDSRVLLNQSRISDATSLLTGMSDILSNVNSMLVAGTFALGASNLSDIGSTVWAQHWTAHSGVSSFGSAFERLLSGVSDAASAATQINSRVLLNQSRISDVYSLLSDAYSDLLSVVGTTGVQLNASTMSDLRSAIAGVVATLTASDISDIVSAVRVNLASDLSDILSAAQQTNSRVLLNQSRVSDVYSLLSDFYSDFQSRVPKLVATSSQLSDLASDIKSAIGTVSVTLTASDISDIASAVVANLPGLNPSDISDIASAVDALLASRLSDILSAAQQGNSRTLVVQSHASNIYSLLSDVQSDLLSLLTTTGVALNASTLSDLRSAIAGVAATLTASDISDIVSAVRINLASDLSDILSAAQQGNSRTLVVQSRLSDVYSLLSDAYSDLLSVVGTTGVALNVSTLSDLRSAITATTFTLSSSDLSDIASAVRAVLVSDLSDILSAAQQGNSRALVVQSSVSDIYSLLSDVSSDLLSVLGTTGVALNASTLSDLRSAITATTFTLSASDLSDIASAVRGVLASDLSDILSAVQQTNSRALVVQSQASDIYSLLGGVASTVSDTYSALSAFESDFGSRFPAAIPELSVDPGATPTWAQANALQYMWLKNNTKSTNSKRFLRNSAGTTVLSATLSDDTVSFVQGKLG